MKILFSGYHNPNFFTITEYMEGAIRKSGHELIVFDDRKFIFPGRLREKLDFLQSWDIERLNLKLLSLVKKHKPDICILAGANRILPQTAGKIRQQGVKTVMWISDPPKSQAYFEDIYRVICNCDFVFAGGSESFELVSERGYKNIYMLPFACDPQQHMPVELTEKDKKSYVAEVAFMGTVDPGIYPDRVKILEQICDFDLGVWGPGTEQLSKGSPLQNHIRGGQAKPEVWRKIYSAAKVVIATHYRHPKDEMPCYQVSPRVYEALACGAFLITDRQKDIFSLFKDKIHLVTFNDVTELRALIRYYLENEDQRKEIAIQGRDFVINNHTYLHRINYMLDIISRRT
ncbi:hypothetical protein EPO66_00770 [bacterium]|nr:MAG: hypothetical protein EPO66_00770 [bacterium]